MATRIEKDFLGEKELPDSAYYGVQTLRGKENFYITGIPMSMSITWGSWNFARRAPSDPLRAVNTVWPACSNAIWRTEEALSSAG